MVDVKHKWNTVQNNTFLLSNYPGLVFTGPNEIEGQLRFKAYFNKETGEIIINPSVFSARNYFIEDEYRVKIQLPGDPENQPPIVYELDNRIVKSGKKHRVSNFLDMHIYKDGSSVCLCPRTQLVERAYNHKAFSLLLLIDELIVPYFYQQGYFERYGSWPIRNYSHGYSAIFEYYIRNKNDNKNNNDLLLRSSVESILWCAKFEPDEYLKNLLENRKPVKPTLKCFCGSGKKYKKCHRRIFTKEAKAGFISFINDLRK